MSWCARPSEPRERCSLQNPPPRVSERNKSECGEQRERSRHGTQAIKRPGEIDRIGCCVRRCIRSGLQRVFGAPGNHRVPGQCTPGNTQAESARRGQQIQQEALAPEGHRARTRRQGLIAAVEGWWEDLSQPPGRNLCAKTQSEDVSRRIELDTLSAGPRRPPCRRRDVYR